jgi:arginyl-tRNA synthetase
MDKKIAQIVKDEFGVDVDVKLTRPEPQFGDYATNVAMQLAKPLGESPRDIAKRLADKLTGSEDIEGIEVAGPGFINLTLSEEALLALTTREPQPHRAGQTVVIETNNPNPFKAMHIGHAYNAILADTMANLYAIDGARVRRVSYHGDVGLHVGKSMWAILKDTGGDVAKLEAIPADERNRFMSKMYAEGSRAHKESEQAKKEIDELAKQSFALDDPTFKAIYEQCAKWSYDEIDAIVKRLGNMPIERRYVESETEQPGKRLIIDNTPGVFTQSNGAYVFEGSKYGSFDNVYIGSNGNGLYGAHDMGLIQLKHGDYPDLDESVVVTGNEQGAYFKGVIAASELAIPELKGKLKNYPTGLVKLSTGKMSSRTGDVIEIGWLFDQFKQAIIERGGEPTDEIVAGALRYQFLKVKFGGDVVFDVTEAVSLTGNTGSYLQYAHARARRILEKVEGAVVLPAKVLPEDRLLVRKLGEYREIVELASQTLEPHHICNYLFELAQEFNRYYEKNQVIGSDEEAHRSGIVSVYADTLQAGLLILGIAAPDKM